MKRILLLFTMLMVIAAQSFAQQRTISGKVTGNDGNPIPFATIQVQGTNTGTTSDENGNFSLSVPGNATLVVRSIGYEPQEIAIGSQSSYNIQLASSTKSLNELVVTALGRTENKSKVGYSTTTFDASQISANAPISVLDNLAGQVAGADISTLGGPGSSTKVVLRGYGVISGGSNQPL
ncbi:MAG TPA: carboxypeptidase-like regulatory domain-containing protein, partial [Candidatus Babeliaceae bacterium]|nr:carboxypeptidase-like regulatory domain-containing protein [Candidatus Babeliaceae bacterium]